MERPTNRRDFLKAVGAGAAALALPEWLAAEPAQRPNIVVFLADDLGYGDLACYEHPVIKTPNLDRFAAQGAKFTQCYSPSSVCSPSRSAILTGRTPYRNGVVTWIPAGNDLHLRRTEVSLARLLKQYGYTTCHVGKWHLNGKLNSPEQPQPNHHGFDWWLATQNNADPSHKNPINFVRNGVRVGKMHGFSSELVVLEAIDWLENFRDRRMPFYLQVWTHEPHLPIESDPAFMSKYDETEDAGQRQHHGNVSQLDHAFGLLMKALDEMGLAENTFVFVTSDNGPEGKGNKGRTRGSTGGLRGRKRSLYEGGIRVPGMARWPGRVKPGSVCSEPVIGSDVFTTVCAVSGVPAPNDRTIDGACILPALEGKPIERKTPLYWRYAGAPGDLKIAMREGDWKILASEDFSRLELYDLAHDPKEAANLADRHPDRLRQMSETLRKLNAEIEAEGNTARSDYFQARPGPLRPGFDETGTFSVVKGCMVMKSAMGVEVRAADEGFAVLKLDEPITDRAVFSFRYRTLSNTGIKNAMFVFGQEAANEKLMKCGTAIGMMTHAVFFGPWARMGSGATKKVDLDQWRTFEALVAVDLKKRTVEATLDGNKLSGRLPKEIERIVYYGHYVKSTVSAFSPVDIKRGR